MEFEHVLTKFLELNRKIKQLNEMVDFVTWDLRTGAPANGVSRKTEIIGALSGDMFRMSIGEDMRDCLDFLECEENFDRLNQVQKALIREARKEFNRYAEIPQNLYEEYVVLKSKSQAAWQAAKQNNDFQGFQGYLEKIVEINKQFIEIWGYQNHPYDALLNNYEPGMTVERLDDIFATLKKGIVPLLERIEHSNVHIDNSVFYQSNFDVSRQRELSMNMLKSIGFDLNSGRLDESEHPFTLAVSAPHDVRLTTKYSTDNFAFSLLATLHEGGHGIYEQNIAPELEGTLLAKGASEGVHESQSRLFENMIGKSAFFWKTHFNVVKHIFPGEFADMNSENFYRILNRVKPSLVRTEADELTYNLHIMIRYEIEKGLFDGSYSVGNLPNIWKKKMKENLGVVPAEHRQGVLQDIHWAAGVFGYFPSYALGNIYAAQFMHAMEKDIPDYREQIAQNEIGAVNQWLRENVHRYGRLLTPDEIIKKATGEPINPAYLMKYLEEKYMSLYGLSS